MSRKLDSPSSNLARNVHIYSHEGHVLGGLWQNGSITNTNFYDMCGIFIIADEPFTIFRLNGDGSTGARVYQNRVTLSPASYVALSESAGPISLQITSECSSRRVTTKQSSSKLTARKKYFRDRVRNRDGHCVITGIEVPENEPGRFDIFNVAHIYPYAREQAWVDQGLSRWITDISPPEQQGETKIHSVQNGLLLSLNIHALFDAYKITVNPEDNYKVICLVRDVTFVDGRILHPCCRGPQDLDRVSDQLLRWHLRQAVLTHMKGAGQRGWETDFPDGMDMMEEIQQGPDAAERMEVELFTRLGAGEIQSRGSPEVHTPRS